MPLDSHGNLISVKPAPVVVEYADVEVGAYTLHRRSVARHGKCAALPGQDQMGYGNKITTDIVLRFNAGGAEHRVYCTCHSNAGSLWIEYRGRRLYLRTHFQDEILDDQ